MARRKSTRSEVDWKAALLADDVFRELLRGTIQQVLEAEMEEAVGASKWERTDGRLGYRSGYSGSDAGDAGGQAGAAGAAGPGRAVLDRAVRAVPAEREGVGVRRLAEMYIQGVSTRKVKAITEELCGHSFSASTVSPINQKLDEELERSPGGRSRNRTRT